MSGREALCARKKNGKIFYELWLMKFRREATKPRVQVEAAESWHAHNAKAADHYNVDVRF